MITLTMMTMMSTMENRDKDCASVMDDNEEDTAKQPNVSTCCLSVSHLSYSLNFVFSNSASSFLSFTKKFRFRRSSFKDGGISCGGMILPYFNTHIAANPFKEGGCFILSINDNCAKVL